VFKSCQLYQHLSPELVLINFPLLRHVALVLCVQSMRIAVMKNATAETARMGRACLTMTAMLLVATEHRASLVRLRLVCMRGSRWSGRGCKSCKLCRTGCGGWGEWLCLPAYTGFTIMNASLIRHVHCSRFTYGTCTSLLAFTICIASLCSGPNIR
jgi:hypothetical protein